MVLTLEEFKKKQEKEISYLQERIGKIQQSVSLVDYLEQELSTPVYISEKNIGQGEYLEFEIRDYSKAKSVDLVMWDYRKVSGFSYVGYEVIFKTEVKTKERRSIPVYCRYENWTIQDPIMSHQLDKYPESEASFAVQLENIDMINLGIFYKKLGAKEDLIDQLMLKIKQAYSEPMPPIG